MRKSIKLLFAGAFLAAILTGCAELPTVGFTFEPAEVNQYAEVTFINTSTGADSYLWDFGDGLTSDQENPTHVFKSAGTFTVNLVASNEDGDSETEQTIEVAEHVNSYTLDGTEFIIDSDIFWYQSSMGGDAYLRLLTPVAGQDNPDLLKLYPNIGLGELPGTYTWDADTPEGSYDLGYTADYAGMAYKWTAIGKTGSGDLVITDDLGSNLYKFVGEMVLSVGSWDFSTGEFTETSTSNISLDYIGGVTPL